MRLYPQLTGDIRSLWFSFGGLVVVVSGWLVTRKRPLGANQPVALTIGWLTASGYLGSSLMNRYRLTSAIVSGLKGTNAPAGLVKAIVEAGPLYENYGLSANARAHGLGGANPSPQSSPTLVDAT